MARAASESARDRPRRLHGCACRGSFRRHQPGRAARTISFGAGLPTGAEEHRGLWRRRKRLPWARRDGPVISATTPSRQRPRPAPGRVKFLSCWRSTPKRRPRCSVYLPAAHVLDVGEDGNHTLHNLPPFAAHWCGTLFKAGPQSLNQALDRFGGDIQMINQHQWPVWGNTRSGPRWKITRPLPLYSRPDPADDESGHGPGGYCRKSSPRPAWKRGWSLLRAVPLQQDARAVYQQYSGWWRSSQPISIPCRRWTRRRRLLNIWAAPTR